MKTQRDPDIIGVTLGWDLKPHLCFKGNTYLPSEAERIFYSQYFQHGDYPTDPITGEELPIVEPEYK
jgi:hypothetical protein